MRHYLATLAITVAIAGQPCVATADAALDQMMRQMDNNPTPTPTPSPSPRAQVPLAAPGYMRSGWSAIAAKTADINTQLRGDFTLLDHIETDAEQLWDQAATVEQEIVQNWPFPHFYWAPGIVGDATETILGPRGAGRVTAPSDAPDPAASPASDPTDDQ